MSETATLHEPDEMGVWTEDGNTVWLPRSLYARRLDAIRWAMDQWKVTLPEVRCLSRWMRWQREEGWGEDQWWECEPADPGAFRVWRLEDAT